MSNTHSSRLSNRGEANQSAVRKIVAERLGCQWCLFLDRDGVINRRVVGDYVRNWQQFEWLPGAFPALKLLRGWAPRLVVVTNQQCIGKGLVEAGEVAVIHDTIQRELAVVGVKVDEIQVCPHLESARCSCRKPKPGLALDWLEEHPDIDPSLSIMIGDSGSDLQLAGNLAAVVGGCASIQIGGADLREVPDASFDCLWEFAIAVEHARSEVGG